MEHAPPADATAIEKVPERAKRTTRLLLTGNIAAGPIYYLVSGLTQAFTRPRFDITRRPFSILANGPLGFVQISTFVPARVGALAAGRRGNWASSTRQARARLRRTARVPGRSDEEDP